MKIYMRNNHYGKQLNQVRKHSKSASGNIKKNLFSNFKFIQRLFKGSLKMVAI